MHKRFSNVKHYFLAKLGDLLNWQGRINPKPSPSLREDVSLIKLLQTVDGLESHIKSCHGIFEPLYEIFRTKETL